MKIVSAALPPPAMLPPARRPTSPEAGPAVSRRVEPPLPQGRDQSARAANAEAPAIANGRSMPGDFLARGERAPDVISAASGVDRFRAVSAIGDDELLVRGGRVDIRV